MSNIGDGFKNIFLAGIGALAYTGEKGKEVIDQLVEKGEITLDQGRELNEELQHKAVDVTTNLRDSALEARLKAMTPEQRDEFVKTAARIAEEQNKADAEKVVEVQADVIESVNNAVDAVADAAESVAAATKSAVEEAAAAVEDAVSNAKDE